MMSHSFTGPRIGAVTYLNAKPLTDALAERMPDARVVYDLPSRLALQLAAGELDVALIPSVELVRHPEYAIVSNACIGCRGPVLSVKLVSRVPMAKIRTLALDEGSLASAALVRILLRQQFDITPKVQTLPIGATLDETDAEAVLLIGDRAIHSPPARLGFEQVWDLGQQWYHATSLPFVFAVWAGCEDRIDGALAETLNHVRDLGVARLEKIATEEADGVGMTVPQCLAYLRDNLHFHLGPEEQKGLQLFHRYVTEFTL